MSQLTLHVPCKNPSFFQPGFVKLRALLALALALIGLVTGALSFAAAASGVWAVAFSPTFGATMYLEDVTCTSTSDCWVVGYYYKGNLTVQTLIEHWNGTE